MDRIFDSVLQALGVFLLGVFVLSFVVMDAWYNYRMCALCLGQRLLLGTMAITLFGAGFAHGMARYFNLVVAALSSLGGVIFSVWHVLLLQGVGVQACPLVIKKKALSWGGRFFGHYTWLPCENVDERFLGMGLSFWAAALFVCVGVFLVYAFCKLHAHKAR